MAQHFAIRTRPTRPALDLYITMREYTGRSTRKGQTHGY